MRPPSQHPWRRPEGAREVGNTVGIAASKQGFVLSKALENEELSTPDRPDPADSLSALPKAKTEREIENAKALRSIEEPAPGSTPTAPCALCWERFTSSLANFWDQLQPGDFDRRSARRVEVAKGQPASAPDKVHRPPRYGRPALHGRWRVCRCMGPGPTRCLSFCLLSRQKRPQQKPKTQSHKPQLRRAAPVQPMVRRQPSPTDCPQGTTARSMQPLTCSWGTLSKKLGVAP